LSSHSALSLTFRTERRSFEKREPRSLKNWSTVKLVLDTMVFIDFLRGDAAARQVMSRVVPVATAPDEGFFSVFTLAELLGKSNLGPAEQATRLAITKPLQAIGIDRALMESAALRASDARNHKPRELLADAIIAASAETVGGTVITKNAKDFLTLDAEFQEY
jgi:predicted nucleic acid-binding protein